MSFPFPPVLDNTMIRAWRSCPKKFWWSFQRHLHPTDASVHLVAGGAFAKGLEVTRKCFFDQELSFDNAIARGGIALLNEYGEFEPSPRYDRKSALNVLGALGKYFMEWPIDSLLRPYRPPHNDKHAIEYSFGAPIPEVKHPESGKELLYAGRFDMIAQYGDSGGIIIGCDDKTASQLGDSWLAQWPLSNQTLGYTWGALQNGLKLSGFQVRGTSLLANSYGHSESTQMFSAWKVEAFERNLIQTVRAMVNDWESNSWRMDLGPSCSSYGGCPFMLLCDSPTPEDWIEVNYIKRIWDPLASRD